jgi:hypothetical protein
MHCYDTCCRPEPEITFVALSRRQVQATRKAHRCTDCNGEIPAGSPAWATAALIDGEFWAGYQHRAGRCTEEYA